MKSTVSHLLFDVAETLLHKPLLIPKIAETLLSHGYNIPSTAILLAHRATREAMTFPDRTSREFYQTFNQRFLAVLGIQPTRDLVEDIFNNCRGLEWEPFNDVASLDLIDLPKGIVSNWDTTLPQKLAKHGLDFFSPLLCSEEFGYAKPAVELYREAARLCEKLPGQIAYIGDSISLDIVPAEKVGMRTILLDRHRLYPYYSGNCISSLRKLPALLLDEPE